MNKLLTYAIMLHSLIVAQVQSTMRLIELQIVLTRELKCLHIKTNTVLSEWTIPKTMD